MEELKIKLPEINSTESVFAEFWRDIRTYKRNELNKISESNMSQEEKEESYKKLFDSIDAVEEKVHYIERCREVDYNVAKKIKYFKHIYSVVSGISVDDLNELDGKVWTRTIAEKLRDFFQNRIDSTKKKTSCACTV